MAYNPLAKYWKDQYDLLVKNLTQQQLSKIKDVEFYKGDALAGEAEKYEHRCKCIKNALNKINS